MQFSLLSQLRALLWRNCLLKWRNRGEVWPEMCFPIFCVTLLVVAKNTITGEADNEEHLSARPLSGFPLPYGSLMLVVAPSVMHADPLMTVISQRLGGVVYEIFPTVKEAEKVYFARREEVLAGIIFEYDAGPNPRGDIHYVIRMSADKLPSTGKLFRENQPLCHIINKKTGLHNRKCEAAMYIHSGFAFLQTVIDEAFIGNCTQTLPLLSPAVEMVPLGEFNPSLGMVTSLYFMFTFSFFINCLTVTMVADKELRTKEGMLMMGLRSSAYWLSWTVVYVVLMLAVTTVVTLIAVTGKLFENTQPALLFVMLLLYGLSVTTLAFLLSTLLSKMETAGAVATFLSLCIASIYLEILVDKSGHNLKLSKSSPSLWAKCLFSPLPMLLAVEKAVDLDSKQGVNFDTLTEGEFPLFVPLFMLLVDTALYLLLAVCLDQAIAKRSSVWFSSSKRDISTVSDTKAPSGSNTELLSLHKKQAIRISNMMKQYRGALSFLRESLPFGLGYWLENTTVTALKKFSLDLYEGQITALLGHNGAGKSTVINILAGVTPPTSGSAILYGLDITSARDREKLRAMCGICPQHSMLYSSLTPKEHLELFAGIKGIPADQISCTVSSALRSVGLIEQRNVMASKLTRGQERRLSIAMAMVGDPKIILLDEPSCSVGPQSRRYLWALLKARKKGRVILMTTHFMQEADIIADRIVIVSKGKIQCIGPPLLLKNRYGMGYYLTMVVEHSFNEKTVTAFFKKFIPEIEPPRSHGKELAYIVPLDDVEKFVSLLRALEEKDKHRSTTAENLGIVTYSVSTPTLEEVFLNLGTVRYLSAGEEEVFDPNEKIKTKDNDGQSPSVEDGQCEREADAFIKQNDLVKRPRASEDLVYSEILGVRKQQTAKPSVSSHQQPADSSVDGMSHRRMSVIRPHGRCNRTLPQNTTLLDEASHDAQRLSALLRLRFLLLTRTAACFVIFTFLPFGLVVGAWLSFEVDSGDPMEVSAKHYIRADMSDKTRKPFLIYDQVNNTVSRSFVKQLSSLYIVDHRPTQLNAVSHHTGYWLGVNILSTDTAAGTLQNYSLMFSSEAPHSLPAAINAISTTQLQLSGCARRIVTYSWPWPTENKRELDEGLAMSLMLGLAFTLTAPTFGIYVVYDKQWNCRKQLRVSGISFHMYWGNTFLFCLIVSFLPTVSVIILTQIMHVVTLKSPNAGIALVLLFVSSFQACLVTVLLWAVFFDQFQTAQAVIPNVFSMMGMAPFLVVYMLDTLASEARATLVHNIVVCLDPLYTVFGGVYYIAKVERDTLFHSGQSSVEKYFSFNSNVPVCLLMNFVHTAFGYVLLWYAVKYKHSEITDTTPSDFTEESAECTDTRPHEDTGVVEERQIVASLDANRLRPKQIIAYVKNLTKIFRPSHLRQKTALKDLSLTIKKGEVLGLVGPNGAGKTTAVNIMSGRIRPTRGKVVVAGRQLNNMDTTETSRDIGFCPQYDPLWESLTLGEHLELYAAIKGVQSEDITPAVDLFVENLKLQPFRNKKVRTLSGGTRRKLVFAMSMLGEPKLVLLDEPSSGMDPRSRRFFWDSISKSFESSDRGAVLITNYMKEADALCSRVGIIIKGELKCLGTTKSLEAKYGGGYMLDLKLAADPAETDQELHKRVKELEKLLSKSFPNARCLERYGECALYGIPAEDVIKLSTAFELLEQAKKTHDVEEYGFSHASLERVFLHFAKQQQDLVSPDEILQEDVALWGTPGGHPRRLISTCTLKSQNSRSQSLVS